MRGVSLISMPYHAGTPEVGMGRGPTALIERHGLASGLGPAVEVEIGGAAITAYDPGCDPDGRMAACAVTVARAIREAAG